MKNNETLEIRPKNAYPKGATKIIFYSLLGIGIVSFFVGGFILFAIAIYALFINPKKIQNDYPISYKLDEHQIIAYCKENQVAWRINWGNIESIYQFSMHWSAPKSLVLVLNKELKFESSFSNKKKTFVGRLFQRFTKPKNNVVIPYQFIDRPTKDFADLLLSYMYTGKLEGIMTE